MPSVQPHVLVIRRRYLGDVVLLGSFFRNLRLHWPDAQITAFVEPAYAAVLSMNPDVNTVLHIPRKLGDWPGTLRALRRGEYTHVFDFDNSEKTALLTRSTGARFRATLHLQNVRRHFPRFYSHAVYISSQDYAAQRITETYLSLLAPAEIPVVTRDVRLLPPEKDLLAARKLVGGARQRILLHPGSRSTFRMWPAENFAAVCDRVQDELDAQIFLVGGPGEAARIADIARHAKSHVVTLKSALSVTQFAALAAECDLMVCHDSGPMHVAAAVGTTVVALFGSQNAAIWRPLGDRHVVLQPPLPCQNCVAPATCVRDDSYRNYCVRNIAVEEVVAAVKQQLSTRKLQ